MTWVNLHGKWTRLFPNKNIPAFQKSAHNSQAFSEISKNFEQFSKLFQRQKADFENSRSFGKFWINFWETLGKLGIFFRIFPKRFFKISRSFSSFSTKKKEKKESIFGSCHVADIKINFHRLILYVHSHLGIHECVIRLSPLLFSLRLVFLPSILRRPALCARVSPWLRRCVCIAIGSKVTDKRERKTTMNLLPKICIVSMHCVPLNCWYFKCICLHTLFSFDSILCDSFLLLCSIHVYPMQNFSSFSVRAACRCCIEFFISECKWKLCVY